MDLSQKNIGIAITGSYCTYKKVIAELEKLASTGANLYPIFSDHASTTDSRFGKCADFLEQAEKITGKKPITTIPDAEPIGPGALFDILVIAPCTGNTLSKLANGISDTPVLMAAKAHLRNNRPLVVALSTNDALGMNLKNIGILLNTKNIYFHDRTHRSFDGHDRGRFGDPPVTACDPGTGSKIKEAFSCVVSQDFINRIKII